MPLITAAVELSWQPITDETVLPSTTEIKARTRGKLRIPQIFGAVSAFNPKIQLRGETIVITQPCKKNRPPILSTKPLSEPAFEQELERRKKGFHPFTYQTVSTPQGEVSARIRLTLPIHHASITFHDSRPDPHPDVVMTVTRKYQQTP